MEPVSRAKSPHDGDIPVDRLIISVRSYVVRGKRGRKSKADALDRWNAPRISPSDWVLVFDCETRTTPDQNLRFGAYQLRYRGHLVQRGTFYDPTLPAQDLIVLRREMAKEHPGPDDEWIRCLTRTEFVRDVFFKYGFGLGAQIVGFNLPFDLSRLAIGHVSARHSMKGGFSLTLIEGKEWPRVTVKHLSQRAALIRFTGTEIPQKKSQPDASDVSEEDKHRDPDRGYFVDLKTLAAAFTSESHSLESLSKLLAVDTIKVESEDHGEALKPEYVQYGMRDVQTTWECFDAFVKRFAGLGLTDTGVYDLYSEASLGKAYLKTMGIKPWLEAQHDDFPPELIGHIMSAYYGGRSEVHIRRQIVPVIHTDFLSMYPTVSTLMGIWEFVRAKSVTPQEDTKKIRAFVERCTPELLRNQKSWRDLTCIVQVLPDRDLFPVRAHYAEPEAATIGLNYLTSDEPLWFCLADVLVSKILTGRTSNILRAVRFRPTGIQDGLRSVTIAGREIDPIKDDFYRALINHRRTVRAREAVAEGEDKRRLNSEQLGIKILANATSYGIFVELNIEELDAKQTMQAYGFRDKPAQIRSDQHEKPGRYFHPLLATLTTGAARLMLALAERQVVYQGLDWAFCDTDSMAIANPSGIPFSEFKERALAVREWFWPLTRPIHPK